MYKQVELQIFFYLHNKSYNHIHWPSKVILVTGISLALIDHCCLKETCCLSSVGVLKHCIIIEHYYMHHFMCTVSILSTGLEGVAELCSPV